MHWRREPGVVLCNNPRKRIIRLAMEEAQRVNCHRCPIDFLSVWEQMWDASSVESPEPKLPLEDLFDCRLRLIEMLCSHPCNRKRKPLRKSERALTKSWGEWPGLHLFAWKVARLEAVMSLFDLSQWISWRAEHGGQFSLNCLRAKAFEEEEFENESLFQFCDLAKWRRVNNMSIIIIFFTVLCGILPKIISVRNDRIFISFQIIIVGLR
jgi:hypothetical protein